MLLDRHPYFFRYLYKDTDKKYKKYVANYDNKVKNILGITLEELLEKEVCTKEEKDMVDNYYKFCPILDDNSVMNKICRYIESINFNLRKKIKCIKGDKSYKYLMNKEEISDQVVYKKVLNQYRAIKKTRDIEINTGTNVGQTEEDMRSFINNKFEYFRKQFEKITSNVNDIVDCLIYIMYVDYPVNDKFLLWQLYGDVIFETLKLKYSNVIRFPLPNEDGDIEYLNKKYLVEEVLLNDNKES